MNCLHIDDINVIAAADGSKGALTKASCVGVKHLYNDYHDLLADKTKLELNAVVICLPNFMHFESIRLAAEAGLDIFIEKPLANSVNECRNIVDLVKEKGSKLMIGHSSRFIDAIGKMKGVADQGHIGNLEALTMEEIINGPFTHGAVPTPVPEWWFEKEKVGGGVLLDLGYHLIDLFRFFTRGECTVLYCCLDHKFNLPIEDGAIVILQSCDHSAKGIINIGWYQKSVFPKFNFRVILHGSAGYVSSNEFVPKNVYLYAMKECGKNVFRRMAGRKIKTMSYTYYATAYYKELRHFFDCVKNDSETSVSAFDGLKTIELIEQAYQISGR